MSYIIFSIIVATLNRFLRLCIRINYNDLNKSTETTNDFSVTNLL